MNVNSLRLEICTSNEDDWKIHLSNCEKGFQDYASFVGSHPDPETRRQFLSEHFRFVYETELSDGRAGLACVKSEENVILYSMSVIYNRGRPTVADPSPLLRTGAEAAEVQISADKWLEDTIHSKMRAVAKTFDFDHVYGDCHVIPIEYRRMGLSRKYGNAAMLMLIADGMARGKLRPDKPIIIYNIFDDIRLVKDQVSYGSAELLHLHDTRGEGKVVCANDHNAENMTPYGFNCVFLYGCQVLGSEPIILKIKQMLSQPSKL